MSDNHLQMIGSMIQAGFSCFIIIGLFFTYRQILQAEEQTKTQFEDDMSRQYRDIIYQLPIELLLGEECEQSVIDCNLLSFHRYFDLTNQQIFLRKKNRIREETWKEWKTGIKSRMESEPFRKAWEEVKKRMPHKEFDELCQLEKGNFDTDPRHWPESSD